MGHIFYLKGFALDMYIIAIRYWPVCSLQNDELLVASKEGDVIAVASLLNSGADIHSQGNVRSFLPSARMRSEGTVVGSVCLLLNISLLMFVRLTSDTTYLTANEGEIAQPIN